MYTVVFQFMVSYVCVVCHCLCDVIIMPMMYTVDNNKLRLIVVIDTVFVL